MNFRYSQVISTLALLLADSPFVNATDDPVSCYRIESTATTMASAIVRTPRTETCPGAAAWESTNHRYQGTWWEGHCNGWAASSVLRVQPVASKRDPCSGLVFSVSEQKGLLAERDLCIVGGSWFSDNPDFLWVPLSPGTCDENNPRVQETWLQAVLNLPLGT